MQTKGEKFMVGTERSGSKRTLSLWNDGGVPRYGREAIQVSKIFGEEISKELPIIALTTTTRLKAMNGHPNIPKCMLSLKTELR